LRYITCKETESEIRTEKFQMNEKQRSICYIYGNKIEKTEKERRNK